MGGPSLSLTDTTSGSLLRTGWNFIPLEEQQSLPVTETLLGLLHLSLPVIKNSSPRKSTDFTVTYGSQKSQLQFCVQPYPYAAIELCEIEGTSHVYEDSGILTHEWDERIHMSES